MGLAPSGGVLAERRRGAASSEIGLPHSGGRSRRAGAPPAPEPAPYWATDLDALFVRTGSTRIGLDASEAERRLREVGPGSLGERRAVSMYRVLSQQLRSPLLLLLVVAAVISAITREWVDAGMVLSIVVLSVGVGARREYKGQAAAAALAARIRARATVVRSGASVRVPADQVVVGDIILLAAGSLVPADAVVIEASDCHVSEAVLTGEAFSVQKTPGILSAATPLARRSNAVYLGSNVQSGTARCLVVATGTSSEYGAIAQVLSSRAPQTEFDRGLERFGYLLLEMMVILVALVFMVHVALDRPPRQTLLFAIALSVGLSPELLPAILSVNLARAASMMASRGVLVRHLSAIENLGSMDILCTDKTGTLTEGVVRLEGAYDVAAVRSPRVLELGALNALFETGLPSPLDDAILASLRPDEHGVTKLAEIPFDFIRKRVSVVIASEGELRLVAKGAFQHVLDVCTEVPGGRALDAAGRDQLQRRHADWAAQGIRVLAVATRSLPPQPHYGREDEKGLTFEGFLTFLDRPKPGAREALADLARLGVQVKVITGDARLVAQHMAHLVGIENPQVLTGLELDQLQDEALWHAAERTDLFVEVDPRQKQRIIAALRKRDHVVGFLGDGVNDAPAMHAADTSVSVDQAVDVARQAADFVLLERDLDVLRQGIEAGRTTFANTLKYVLTTTSANLGNMISMALASLFLPFLPLLAGQILLNNFLSDIPAIGLADDAVDDELVSRPRRWNMGFIGRFMLQFGMLSSVFDLITFGLLLFAFSASVEEFRTGWFVQSLLTELIIALVVRTRRPFYRSRPGRLLLVSTLILAAVALSIPYLPGVRALGFTPLPLPLLLALVGVTIGYVGAAEVLKRWFYRRRANVMA
jgi:P-type Mg2+ transporter